MAAGDSQLPPTFRGDDSLASGLSEDVRPKDSWEPSHRAVQVRGLESTSGGLPWAWAWRGRVKALVWFWLIDETLSANLVYQDDYEIGSTTPSDDAMTKIMTMVIAW